MKTLPRLLLLAGLLALVPARATLVNGSANIDYDKTAWDSLGAGWGLGLPLLTLSEFFNQAEANARTQTQLISDDLPGAVSYTGQTYLMNGPTVANLLERYTQPTTFEHTPGDADGHTGLIGLGGVSRFSGPLLVGDFTLGYDALRVGGSASGWFLYGNIAPAVTVFDLMNVSVVDNASTLSISGRLGVSAEVATLLLQTPADTLRDVGSFSFTANVVPEPSTAALGLMAAGLLAATRRRTR